MKWYEAYLKKSDPFRVQDVFVQAEGMTEALGEVEAYANRMGMAVDGFKECPEHKMPSFVILSHKATPEEIHEQRVAGASGGDPDPS